MLDEIMFRRPRFRPGPAIRLGNGQGWIFPAPPADDEVGFGPEYVATVEAVVEAEDHAERLRAELALAIALLAHNYDLGPAEFQQLLGFTPGSPELGEAQHAFHELARDHVCSLRARSGPQPAERDRLESRHRPRMPLGLWLWGWRSAGRRGRRSTAAWGRSC